MNFHQFVKDTTLSQNTLNAYVSLYKVHVLPFETNGMLPTDQISPCIRALTQTTRKDNTKLAVFNLLQRLMKHATLEKGMILCFKNEFHSGKLANSNPQKQQLDMRLDQLFKLGEYRKYLIQVFHLKYNVSEHEMKQLELRDLKRNHTGVSATDHYVYIISEVKGVVRKIKILGSRIVMAFHKTKTRFHVLDPMEKLEDFM